VAVSDALRLVRHNDSAGPTTIPRSMRQCTACKHAVQVARCCGAALKITIMRKDSCSDCSSTSAFVMVSRLHSSAESIGAGSRNFGVGGIPQRLLNSNLAQFRDLDAAISRLPRGGAVSAVAGVGSAPNNPADQNPNRQSDDAQRNDFLPSDCSNRHVPIISRLAGGGRRDSYLACRMRRVTCCGNQACFRATN